MIPWYLNKYYERELIEEDYDTATYLGIPRWSLIEDHWKWIREKMGRFWPSSYIVLKTGV